MAAVSVVTLALVATASTGCGDNCGMVNCSGDNVAVWWSPGDVDAAAQYRICLDDLCEAVLPEAYGAHVLASVAGGKQNQEVRFQVVDPTGSQVLAEYSGTAHISGRCCPGAEMRIQDDGTLRNAKTASG